MSAEARANMSAAGKGKPKSAAHTAAAVAARKANAALRSGKKREPYSPERVAAAVAGKARAAERRKEDENE